MSQFDDLLDWVNGLDTWTQWAVGLSLTILTWASIRLVMRKVVLDFVRQTSIDWDDQLYSTVTKRLYVFILIVGVNMTMVWVIGKDDSFVKSITPFIQATYILLTTSLASVTIKIMIPVVMDRFADPTAVKVSGSNSLIIFLGRAAVWFGGLYLAFSELGIDLLGVLATLAVFSLIIGLAMQQTLGNIVNSFMLALDQPFEVGDRIEVEGKLGSVVSVGILSTKILTHEENLVVIPNNSLVNSTIINHARGGGDGEGRRISLVQDIGVSYDEDIDHVKYTILKLIRECPYVLDTPEPRVLLIELGDFAKVFRMYCWVGDYSDEYVTRDWVLKNLDEQFKDEGIEIPYPTVVEINEESESYSDQRGKKASVRVARLQMIKEDKKLLEERAAAKIEVDIITQKLKDPDLDRKEKQMLEDDLNELNKVLGMFEAGGDD